MKRSVVLVLDADADTARAVASAAAGVSCDIRFVRTSKESFNFCHDDFENVAAIVLDVDTEVRGMAILEALGERENTPPIIVVSALEQRRLSSVVQQHGATTCLVKPLSFLRLANAIGEALLIAAAAAPRCDVWGHIKPCGCICTKTNALPELTGRN